MWLILRITQDMNNIKYVLSYDWVACLREEQNWVPLFIFVSAVISLSLRDLRRRSAAARLLGLCVRISQLTWMIVSCACCVLSGRGLCVGLITHWEEFYRVWCVWVWSWILDNGDALPSRGYGVVVIKSPLLVLVKAFLKYRYIWVDVSGRDSVISIIIYLFTAIWLLPGGSGYFTCIQNMKLVTNKFKSGGLHEKHVVATWNVGNRLSICL